MNLLACFLSVEETASESSMAGNRPCSAPVYPRIRHAVSGYCVTRWCNTIRGKGLISFLTVYYNIIYNVHCDGALVLPFFPGFNSYPCLYKLMLRSWTTLKPWTFVSVTFVIWNNIAITLAPPMARCRMLSGLWNVFSSSNKLLSIDWSSHAAFFSWGGGFFNMLYLHMP